MKDGLVVILFLIWLIITLFLFYGAYCILLILGGPNA